MNYFSVLGYANIITGKGQLMEDDPPTLMQKLGQDCSLGGTAFTGDIIYIRSSESV